MSEVNMTNVQNIEQEIAQLSKEKQWELLNYLLQHFSPKTEPQKNDLPWSLSLGLGKEVWNSVDAQDYVNQMRSER
ncbi:MAG: hypothetical protein ACYCVH_13190 [Ignavibacteriaceae bacterium]